MLSAIVILTFPATAGEVPEETLYPMRDLVRARVQAGEALCFEEGRRAPEWVPMPSSGASLEAEVAAANARGATRYHIDNLPACRLVKADALLLLDTIVEIKGGKQSLEEAMEEWDEALEAAVGLPVMVLTHPIGWPVDVPGGSMTARAALEAMAVDVGVPLVWSVVWMDASFFVNGPPDEQGRWIINVVSPRGSEPDMPSFRLPTLTGNEPGVRTLPGGRVEYFRIDPATGEEVIMKVERLPARAP